MKARVLIICLFHFVSSIAMAETLFTRSFSKNVGNSPEGIAVGEFTNDSVIDAFVSFSTEKKVMQFSFDENQGFEMVLNSGETIPNNPSALCAADFNGDGHLDLAVGENASDNNDGIRFFYWVGVESGVTSFDTDTFFHFSQLTENIGFIEAIDFNGDKKQDLTTVELDTLIFINEGNKSFIVNSYSATGIPSRGITLGDFNKDGKADIASSIPSTNKVVIFRGKGPYTIFNPNNWEFYTGPDLLEFSVGSNPYGMKSVDLDNDTDLDLIVANHDSNSLSVLLNDGQANFSRQDVANVCSGPLRLVSGDFNNDAKPDMAVICDGDGNLNVLVGDGKGGLSAQGGYQLHLGDHPYEIVSDDFNKDGRPDLLISVEGSNKIVTLLGNKAPALTAPTFADGELAITYTDNDNEKPDASTGGSIKVKIDGGTEIALEEADKNDTNVADGKIYKTLQTLNPGTHSIEATANDGTYSTTLKDNISVSAGGGGGGCAMTSQTSPDSRSFISLALCLSLTFLITRLPQKRKELNS